MKTKTKLTIATIVLVLFGAIALFLMVCVLPPSSYDTFYPRKNPDPEFDISFPTGSFYAVHFDLPGLPEAQVEALRSKVSAAVDPDSHATIERSNDGGIEPSRHEFFELTPHGFRTIHLKFHFSETDKWPEKINVSAVPPSP